mmetsp:Transcript_17003/g.22060  ORF Transcript_17003/g.22060 Transcript_17003/m.22060 type:complete len:552 (-) Transcript_17003:45-1700(-)
MVVASDGFIPPSKKKNKSLMRFAKISYGPKLFDMLTREVDLLLGRQIDQFEKNINSRLEQMAISIDKVESNIAAVLAHHEVIAAESEVRALEAVDKERVEKKVLCQWLNGFLSASSHELRLDPIDFAFARFALNMAVAAADTSVELMLAARVPGFLVGMLASDNDVVLGPASIALAHLALLDEARIPICDQGAIGPLVQQCRSCKSPAVLTQICKVLAALASRSENRQRVAGEGGTAAICELISEATEFMDFPRCTNGARGAALTALVNFTYNSDANKKLLVEMRGLAPIIDATVNSPDSNVVLQALRCLGNVGFNQPYCAAAIITSRGIDAIAASLEASDLLVDHEVFEAGLTTLGNLCNNEQNQTNVGASRSVGLAIHISRYSTEPAVILVACRLLCALSFSSFVNKTQLGELGAIEVTLEVFRRYGFGDVRHSTRYQGAVAWACKALASILLHKGNQTLFRDCFGISTVVDLLLETEHIEVIHGAAMILAAVCPPAEERFDAKDEGRMIQVEQVRTFDGLNRAKNVLFGHTDDCPEWLQNSWEVHFFL